jgi:hypothetical protein
MIGSQRPLWTVLLSISMVFMLAGCKSKTESIIEKLESDLSNYEHQKVVTIESQTQGKHRNYQSDVGFSPAFIYLYRIPEQYDSLVIDWLQKNASRVPGPYMMELGRRVFGHKLHEGMTWYTVGLLRSSYDAKRCQDRRVATEIMQYREIYREIEIYSHDNPAQHLRAWNEAIAWDESHSYKGSPMWACARSMKAFKTDPKNKKLMGADIDELMVPESQWDSIRADHFKEAHTFLDTKTSIKSETKTASHPKNH